MPLQKSVSSMFSSGNVFTSLVSSLCPHKQNFGTADVHKEK